MRLERYKNELFIPAVEQKEEIGYHFSFHLKASKKRKALC
jgi:hypothetical protein